MDIPLSYKTFFSKLKGFEFRYTDKQYYVLLFAFFEMIIDNIIRLEIKSGCRFIISSIEQNNVPYSLYKLLLRPLENNQNKMELEKYIYRIGIYGYYSTNTFSKYSLQKVIHKEFIKKGYLVKKGIWPFIFYKKNFQVEEEINFETEKNRGISKINKKLNLNKEELEHIINSVHSNLLISLDTIQTAITLIGK
jgi:hypothetical protein